MTQSPREPATERSPQLAWTFFRLWLKNPLAIAALSPSGRQLAGLMVRGIDASTHRVVELGGGTGVFTRAILDAGLPPERLMVVELDRTLHQHLSQQFPAVRVAHGNAAKLVELAHSEQFAEPGEVSVVVSGLGLLSMSRSLQEAILGSAMRMLAPGGRFIQFTYGPACPVPRSVLGNLGLDARRVGFALWNAPPASVYEFVRNEDIAATQ